MQHSAAWVRRCRTVLRSQEQPFTSCQQLRHQTDGTTQRAKPPTAAEQAAAAEDSTPPSAAAAVATMGAGGT